MEQGQIIYDPAAVDGRFQRDILALRWILVVLYGVLYYTNVIDADAAWFLASEGLLIAYHVYYTATVWYEASRGPLPPAFQYATPFFDTLAVSLALIAVGDPLYPIWAVYFTVIAGVAFFYYSIIRGYTVWLLANYALVGMALHLRGLDTQAPMMAVATIILLAAIYNLSTYTGGERRLRVKLGEVAQTDPLTNLPNRRGLEAALEQHLASKKDAAKGTAVLMIDVDRFKRYNDQFGHLVADGVLEQIAHILGASVREPDRVARYGGDEFVIIVSNVTGDDAMLLAERLRNQVARTGLCTISAGVAIAESGECSVEEVLNLADAALRVAKQAGRNQVHGPWRKARQAA